MVRKADTKDSTAITSLALTGSTPPLLVTSHQSQTIRFYPLPASTPDTPQPLSYTRQLPKAHSAIILISAVSPDDTLLATGSSDGIVKVWDLAGGFVTHLFRGHGGPVSALKFNFPQGEERRMELLTGSTDGRVRVFDLKDTSSRTGGGAAKPRSILEGHVSVVRGIDVTVDGRWAITGGRDKVVLVWDLYGKESKKGKEKESPKLVQTIIAGEQVETVGLLPVDEGLLGLPAGRLRCWTGGEKGAVKLWDVFKAEEVGQMGGVEGVDEAEVDEDEQRGILNVLYVAVSALGIQLMDRHDPTSSSLISIHADQNIIYHSLATGQPTRQIIGFNDEIIDATFLSHSSALSPSSSTHSHLALATNSNLIRLYSLSTFSATLLSGHRDMVLCLDKSADYSLLASGSKDNTARLWAPTPGEEGRWRSIAVCEGHAESIGAVALSRKSTDPKFLVTASQDRTLKLWDLTTTSIEETESRPRSLSTIRAHEKDINSLDISPNDRFLASGSQDKLVKIYAIDFDEGKSGSGATGALKPLGTCKGHRRGVWTVKFSKTDRVVASGAADRTVKLWSLDDYTCLKVCPPEVFL